MRSLFGAVLDRIGNAAPVSVSAPSSPYVGMQAASGMNGQLDAMGSNGTLFAIVSQLANATASVHWHMHRLNVRGSVCPDCEAPNVALVEDHLALRVWDKPNEVYTRQEFVEGQQQHVDLCGEGWWLVVREHTPWPEQLWPIRPDRVIVVPSKGFGIAGYIYRGPEGERVPLEKTDLIGLRMPNPMDPYRGMGPVQTLMVDLDAAHYSALWNRNFFLNSAEPGGVVEFPEGLSDEEWKTFVSRWAETHKGVNNAHRVATIERGKWVSSTATQRDMQFAQLRELSRDTILEAFGLSKFAIGVVTDINRATADASKAWFAEAKTVPRLERFRQALNRDLLPLFGTTGKGVAFAYCSPVPADEEAENAQRASKAQAYSVLVAAGVDPDDAASVCGLPPMRVAAPVQVFNRVDNAPRWIANETIDKDTCQPCKDNDGHRYMSEDDADADYPGGAGYVGCEGRLNCRGTITRKGRA